MYYTNSTAKLIAKLHNLPGIGPKTAERLAFHILKNPLGEAESLAEAILEVKKKTRFCSLCHNITEEDPCKICQDVKRDHSLLCIVEEVKDVIALEKTNKYKGIYYVLLGVISPLEGIGPDDLKIKELWEKLKKGEIKEVIVATNPNTKGETTALYLAKLIKPLGVKITRLAYGLPAGGDLEYADEVTLTWALEGRREIKFD